MTKNNILSRVILPRVILFAAALALCSCTDVKEDLGVGRNSPDEFTVVQRAPLTLPPEYTLRPPGDAGETPPAAEAATQARTALLGKETTPAVEGASEKAMLDKLGVASIEPDIRKKIDQDNGYIALKSQTVAEKLIFWDDAPTASDIPLSVVDPQKEAERIKKNKEEGKPINDGAVPVIEKKESTLDKIF